jgi:hypothetical protein
MNTIDRVLRAQERAGRSARSHGISDCDRLFVMRLGGMTNNCMAWAVPFPGRHRLESQPFSRNGENSPYGMLGGIVETSGSFEARSAPRFLQRVRRVVA